MNVLLIDDNETLTEMRFKHLSEEPVKLKVCLQVIGAESNY